MKEKQEVEIIKIEQGSVLKNKLEDILKKNNISVVQ